MLVRPEGGTSAGLYGPAPVSRPVCCSHEQSVPSKEMPVASDRPAVPRCVVDAFVDWLYELYYFKYKRTRSVAAVQVQHAIIGLCLAAAS